ncbi:MAG TPA: Crp/Fnr family transcriptional regulator [Chloroflexota bacterium]|jgi:CRP-like cAMP-binding protein|nr:Crp/Fnr family transcriptional regulator [Chloroflexota bacterium]
MDLEEALAKAPLFQGLERKDIRNIAKRAKVVNYGVGHVIIEEGSGGYGGMGVVLSGSCRVTKDGATVDHVKAGQVFGEMSLIDDRPRSASVIADEPTQAAEISAWEFRAQIKENPELAINLLKTLSNRLRDTGRGAQSG